MFYVQLFISNTYYTICKFLCLLYTWYSFQGFTKGQKVARSHLTKLCTFLPFAYICLYCVVCCQWFYSFHKHKNKNWSIYPFKILCFQGQKQHKGHRYWTESRGWYAALNTKLIHLLFKLYLSDFKWKLKYFALIT